MLRIRKVILYFLTLLTILVLISLAINYLLIHHSKKFVELLVDKESNHTYHFNAGNFQIDLLDRSLLIENASIVCKNSSGYSSFYNANFKNLKIKIHSWKDILFNKHVGVDRIILLSPDIEVNDNKPAPATKNNNTAFHLSSLSATLNKFLSVFELSSFKIQDARIVFKKISDKSSLAISGVDLDIRNMSSKRGNNQKFLSAEDIDLTIKKQSILLTDQVNRIGFSSIHFSGKNEDLQIDSLLISSSGNGKASFNMFSELVLLNSSDLSALYKQEYLKVDSFTIVRPVLKIVQNHNGSNSNFHQDVKRLFADFYFQYIDVIGGKVEISNTDNSKPVVNSQSVDLRLLGLAIDRNTHKMKVEGLDIDDRNFSFVSKDSAYQLQVGQISYHNNYLWLNNVRYAPLHINKLRSNTVFKAPAIQLKELSLEELLFKRLVAEDATLVSPDITITHSVEKHHTDSSSGMEVFYHSLNSLADVVQVDDFKISNGDLKYWIGHEHFVQLNDITARIQLMNFFRSGSLRMIKQSIPALEIKNIIINIENLTGRGKQYLLKGITRHNTFDYFEAELQNGLSIKAEKMEWDSFKWDELQANKKLDIAQVHIGVLNLRKSGAATNRTDNSEKKLPLIKIGKFRVDSTIVDESLAGRKIDFFSSGLTVDNFESSNNQLSWGIVTGQFNRVKVSDQNFDASIENITLSNEGFSTLQGLNIKTQNARAFFPEIHFIARMHTPDPENLDVDSIYATGEITIKNKSNSLFTIPTVIVRGNMVKFKKNEEGKLDVQGDFSGSVDGASAFVNMKDSAVIKMQMLKGNFKHNGPLDKKIIFPEILTKVNISGGQLLYKNKQVDVEVNRISWNIIPSTLGLYDFKFLHPGQENLSKNSSLAESISVVGESLEFKNMGVELDKNKTSIRSEEVILDKINIHSFKDKTKNVVSRQKSMLTETFNRIQPFLFFNKCSIQNSKVTVHEIIDENGKSIRVPLNNVNAEILNLTTRPGPGDSITLKSNFLIEKNIALFSYSELYQDSNALFNASVRVYPFLLNSYNSITKPSASVSVRKGFSNSMHAVWKGDKNSAMGYMNFNYDNLRIQMHKKNDPEKNSFLLDIENALVNLLAVRDKNSKNSTIFFVRNKEKSFFNYWVKSVLSGIGGAVIRTKERTTRKRLQRHLNSKVNLYSTNFK